MFSSNSVKILLVSAAIFCHACSLWQNKADATPTPAPFLPGEFTAEIPFSTREPDVYQAEIVLINYNSGEKTERRTFVARSGEKLRCDYESKISFLQLSAGQRFLLDNEKKIYAENQKDSGFPAAEEDNLQNFLTNKWLNEKTEAKFEKLGAENGSTKYRVKLDDSAASEILIYVDENFKIPVRQEFYSVSGEQKNLAFAEEVRYLKLQTDENVFSLPKDYKKVSLKEFQNITQRKRFDAKN